MKVSEREEARRGIDNKEDGTGKLLLYAVFKTKIHKIPFQ